jgi:hypothetical protein
MVIEGFIGGYHYAFNKFGQLKIEPEKNEYSHIHDALQYVCTRILGLDTSVKKGLVIPSPHYNFNHPGAVSPNRTVLEDRG